MRLIANVKINYGRGRDNRVIEKGEQFDTENDRDGNALLAVKRARRPLITLQRKDLQAAEPAAAEETDTGERSKRRYRRRDLQATE